MQMCTFKPPESIPILSIVNGFKIACHSNSMHEGDVMWFFPYFIREPGKVASLHQVTADRKKDQRDKNELTTYCQMVNYLLET